MGGCWLAKGGQHQRVQPGSTDEAGDRCGRTAGGRCPRSEMMAVLGLAVPGLALPGLGCAWLVEVLADRSR